MRKKQQSFRCIRMSHPWPWELSYQGKAMHLLIDYKEGHAERCPGICDMVISDYEKGRWIFCKFSNTA